VPTKRPSPPFNAVRKEALQGHVKYITYEQTIKLIDDILEFIKFIDYNLNINSLVENIFTRIAMLNSLEKL
jgi:hypothetical protein